MKKRKVIKKTKEEILSLRAKMTETVRDLLITAFGLVAALAWNSAIQKLFEVIFPEKANSLVAMFSYAVSVTIIVVLAIYYLTKVTERLNRKDKEEK